MDHSQRWKQMLRNSWSPLSWYGDVAERLDFEEPREERKMWVYRETERGVWTTGFYDPKGDWNADHDYSSREEAAVRVHYLNGGQPPSSVAEAAKKSFERHDG